MAFDGAYSSATDLGGIFIRQPFSDDQQQRLALVCRDLLQGSEHVQDTTPCVLLRGRPQPSRIRAIWVRPLPLSFAVCRVEPVAQDREEPCLEVRARLEAVDVLPRAQDGVLHQVACGIWLVGERERKGAQA